MPDERDRTSDRKAVARDPLEGLGELSGVLRRARRQDAPGRAFPPAPPQATAEPPAVEPRESTDSAVRTRGAGAPDSGLFWDLELDPTPDSAAGRPRPSRAARADSTSRQRGVGGFGPSRRPDAGPRGDPPLESRRHDAAGESLPRSVGDGAAPQAGPEEAPEAPDADAPSPGTPPENGREAAPAAGRPDGPLPRTEGAREGEDVPQAPLTSPADVERRYEDAKRLAAAGEYARAIDAYHEVLRHEPGHVRARNNLGFVYDCRGDYDLAITEYRQALELDGRNVQVHCNLGAVYGAKGWYDKAEEVLKQALRLEPKSAEAHCNLGIVYCKKGLYHLATAELKRAVELDADYVQAFYYLGECYNHLDRIDDAIEAFERTLEGQPQNHKAYYNLGILFDKKNMPDRAMRMYRRAREVQTGS